jgi:pimeloyl-ACP methyl ester carboxylesterase
MTVNGQNDRFEGNTIWMALQGAEIRYYQAGSIRTRCIEAGSGPPLILLHGSGGHAEAWAHNLLALSEHFHVYAIDMVGHGLSDKPDLEYVISDYCDHLGDFMSCLGIERAHVAGLSLGGWAAKWFALDAADRLLSVVSCTGGGLRRPDGETATEASERSQLMVPRAQAVVDSVDRESVRKRVEMLFHRLETVTDELVDVRFQIYRDPQMRESYKKIHHITPFDNPDRIRFSLTEERLRQIKVPVLFLWTDHNPGVGVETAQWAADLIEDSQLKVMENCGHWPQWEDPPVFNRLMIEFLTSVEDRASKKTAVHAPVDG